jgi:hypothetical protein
MSQIQDRGMISKLRNGKVCGGSCKLAMRRVSTQVTIPSFTA